MYVITGASGNIGRVVSETLLKEGHKVRAIARDRNRLNNLAQRGAEIMPGSLDDSEFLARAFEGNTAVFTMIPPNITATDARKFQHSIGESITVALKKANVSSVVNLSSLGAEVPEGTGPIAGLHSQEGRLNGLRDLNVLHLRPGYFMENFLSTIPLIKGMNINGSSLRTNLPVQMIATRDIANHAAGRLARLDFKGKSVQGLLGQRDVNMSEATAILGKAIGKPNLPYIEFGRDDALKGLVQAGMSPSVAKHIIEMWDAFNEGVVRVLKRTPENTTDTSIEDFARDVFAPAYNS